MLKAANDDINQSLMGVEKENEQFKNQLNKTLDSKDHLRSV